MQNAGVNEAKARIKGDRRNINNFRHGDDTTLMAESEELKSVQMKVKKESEKVGLKLNIHVHMDMERREERMRYVERLTWKLTLPYVK